MATKLQNKLIALSDALNSHLVERENEVAGALTALAAGEHLLLLGKRGTAKTMLCELLTGAISGADYFYWLLTRFSQPEELFGPVSYQGLRNDSFERVVDGKLPTCHLAFLDECFKANSAILNSMLTVLNERRFHNGRAGAVDCPLIMAMGASNEMPEGEELDALFDRFMVRFWVSPIKNRENRKAMILAGAASIPHALTLDDIVTIRNAAANVKVDDTIVELLLDVHAAATKEGHDVSDRRLRKSLAILRANAYVTGADEVTADNFEILGDVFWIRPDGRDDLRAMIRKIANPVSHRAQEILDAAKDEFRKVPFAESDRAGLAAEQISALTIKTKGKLSKAERKLTELKNGKPAPSVDAALTEIKNMTKKVVELYSNLMAGV